MPVAPGCAVFLTKDGLDESKKVAYSPMTTICTCDVVGPLLLQTHHMQQYGLMKGNMGMVSMIATGEGVTITLYDNENFDADANKVAIGPENFMVLSKVALSDDDNTDDKSNTASVSWNDKIKSLSIMSWSPCLGPKKYNEETCPARATQSPVSLPVRRP